MTIITPTYAVIDGRRSKITWPSMSVGDEGSPVEVSGAIYRSFQAIGGSPVGSIDINISNDASTWAAPTSLTDRTPTDFDNRARYVKPVRTSGSGSADVILILSN